MRRFLTPLIACASLALSAQVPEPTRMALFSMREFIGNSVKARKVYAELEVLQKQLMDKLQAKQAEGQKLNAQLQSTSISDEGKVQIQKQLRDLEFEFKKMQEDAQTDSQKVQQKVMKALNDLADPVVKALASEQKLQVILSAENSPIVWAQENWASAFTLEVAKRLDAADGAPAPAAPAAKKPAAAPAKKP
ncbi:MAG TPA: OmpH family outer membrane protein [Holophagaceae bacterium]|nr:OmpH family outer membrane protein [Holophagaceae bacterium]